MYLSWVLLFIVHRWVTRGQVCKIWIHDLGFFVLDDLLVVAVAELDLGARGMEQRIPKVFIDPSGKHSIFTVCSSATADTYYLHGKWRKPRMFSRLKGSTVSCVAWNRAQINEGCAQLGRV